MYSWKWNMSLDPTTFEFNMVHFNNLGKRKWLCICIICWMTCKFIQCTTTRGEILHPTFIATGISCHINITYLAWATKNSYCPWHMTSSCQSTMEKRTSIFVHMIECQSMWLHPLTKTALNSKEPMPCINKLALFFWFWIGIISCNENIALDYLLQNKLPQSKRIYLLLLFMVKIPGCPPCPVFRQLHVCIWFNIY